MYMNSVRHQVWATMEAAADYVSVMSSPGSNETEDLPLTLPH